MKLLKVHIFEEADLRYLEEEGYTDISEIDVNTYDFNWDYAQTALVDEEKSEVLIWNDNMHTYIDKDIENFINGLKYAGVDVEIKECVMMYDDLLKKYSGVRYR